MEVKNYAWLIENFLPWILRKFKKVSKKINAEPRSGPGFSWKQKLKKFIAEKD
jgi:hypothetical protein